MKRTLFFLVLGLLLGTGVKGQIKIGDNPQTIDPSSVLELESGSRVLVVTRVSTAEMNAITPLPGAVVYNTDLQCVHYYNGTEWINICEEVGGIPNLTTEPFVNTRSTIVITTDGENNHIEVAQNSIRTEQIVDGGINGVDIQNNSIGNDKLGNDAVGREEIIDNAVGIDALDTSQVTLESFTNTPGFITDADIISGDTGNDLMIGVDGGAFYDEQPVLDAITTNTGDISTNGSDIDTNTASILSNALNIGLNADNIQINTDNILLKEDAANKSDDVALGNSADLFPTQNAVKTYVDNATGAVSTLNNGEIYVGNASNVATSVAMSGDATIDNTGAVTIEDDAITTAKILNNAITTGKIRNSAVTEIKIADAAVTPIKIEPSPTIGRYLSTNASGVVEWVDLPAAAAEVDGIIGNEVTGPTDGTLTVTGLGTNANPLTLDVANGGIDTNELANGAVTTGKISNEAVTPAKIEPSTTNGQYLTTDGTGNVAWVDLPAATAEVDGIVGNEVTGPTDGTLTLSGGATNADPLTLGVSLGGIDTDELADNAVTTAKILPGAADQILRTNAAGNAVSWVDLPPSGTSDIFDATTISGTGVTGDAYTVADDAITTIKILNANVTDEKIAPGAADQILRTNAAGTAVEWVDFPPSGASAIFDATTISGTGVTGDAYTVADDAITTIKILDANVTDEKIAPGAADQILRTNAAGTAVEWVDFPPSGASAIFDATTISGTGVTGDAYTVADDAITSTKIALNTIIADDINTGAVTTDEILNGTILAEDINDDAVTSTKILDDNVTIEKIAASANDGQVLTTSGTDVVWANPTVMPVSADGSTITGDGSTTDLSVPTDGITTTQIADLTIATIDIADNNVTPAKIAEGANGEVLTTNAAGDVVWAAPTVLPVSSDGTTITGDGSTTDLSVPTDGITTTQIADLTIATIDIADNNVTPAKIAEGANGEVLTTNAAGDVVWAAPTVLPVSSDGTTITGDGSTTDLSVPTNGITTTQIADLTIATIDIADNNVTPTKIAEGANGEVLTTDAAGDVVWAAPTVLPVSSDGSTITGDGSTTDLSVPTDGISTTQIADLTIATIDIADNNVTPAKIAEGANGEVLTTDAAGDVVWAAPTVLPVSSDGSTITGDGSTTDLSVPTDGITTTQIADLTIATIDIADNNVTPAKIAEGANGEVLTTDAAGDVVWAAPTVLPVSSDGSTITGNGSTTDLSVPTGGITTAQILDGTILTEDIADDAVTTLKILDDNVTPDKIQQGTDGQVLTTNGTDVVWATPNSTNLSTTDLTQTSGEDRTYDLNGQNLQFLGSGNIGIGNFGSPGSPTNINDKLHVDGQIRAEDGFATRSGSAALPTYGFYTNSDNDIGMYRAGIDELGFSTNGIEALKIDEFRNVGIGPNFDVNTIDARLHVDGNLIVEGQIYTDNAYLPIPDYVFEKYFKGKSTINDNYQFKSLKEVESFIKKFNHLPGVVSAKQAKADGKWNLSKSSLNNLEKIEELFLHTIEQEKKIDQLQNENRALTKELETLKSDIDLIKQLLLTKEAND
ncbi:bZIP transcription factor [Maribacter luteus]|uniref:Peptidase S74 domain-containing protein n=1 Tax=Maribacter luteus TaxID=2594478 RepID=A0A6I2MSJ8_9FLAO|nr:bZIP transcription factor [Maribacter luteus]MRX65184.1 hypothetical protein [Maribacter luteus]